ncbi:MAG TPA: SGNH hydrolase domain-containing protein [Solirubrobacteraceae bacterium]|nr:SGNH hydrolase domain-containing protein [Solirubrobacteraceae bacterium]
MPNSPCEPADGPINLCTFGAPATQAVGTVALVGDSHAWHWRAAVEVVAQAQHWRALDSTRSSCPFTRGAPVLPEPKRAGCIEWNRSLLRWFKERPEISTVFTSDHPALVTTAPGQSRLSAQVAGITAAWAALPANVRHIVVIRDIPYMHEDTLACVEAAMRSHRDAGVACAVPRGEALHEDPDVVAAERLRSPRVQVIELTQFFCDSHLCYPVVGGALVYRDSDHLTSVFAATVGPFLLHSLGKLMTFWG